MAVVKVPRTPKSSFNQNRRPSKLLLDQIKHLEWAALPASERTPRAMAKNPKPKTEAQAAERIEQLTKMVMAAKEAAADPKAATPANVVLPPMPTAPRPSAKTRVRARKKPRRRVPRRRRAG